MATCITMNTGNTSYIYNAIPNNAIVSIQHTCMFSNNHNNNNIKSCIVLGYGIASLGALSVHAHIGNIANRIAIDEETCGQGTRNRTFVPIHLLHSDKSSHGMANEVTCQQGSRANQVLKHGPNTDTDNYSSNSNNNSNITTKERMSTNSTNVISTATNTTTTTISTTDNSNNNENMANETINNVLNSCTMMEPMYPFLLVSSAADIS
ncbi:putative uncharacterized protein DDB_G0286901 [Stomoxys calcitrans]|uniref:putative uncharacterized protein DDB_G0286901 n=1 Tax=Stomoxys calcitrans TaxID=35570 RepID=UPI0027E2E3DB|nr:putative uncharacterized protein DDB_G0286901 [Stomoxys calcitrans]